jgi:hypothetical protein
MIISPPVSPEGYGTKRKGKNKENTKKKKVGVEGGDLKKRVTGQKK